ncbi:DUF6158 family protein [Micromonospora sp. NBC_01699]|uniref:DUF6158 family protein n=1 Tax=Micromonospora sp. NBC_01699 TaxID=2975984 RepID=UPI002E2E029B|nr:DUF6158 family protein [Micromonospora sp. NBC_01699]
MTESVRGAQFGAPGSVDDSPEQRVGEWDGDHPATSGTVAAGFTEDETEDVGIDPAELGDDDLIRELHSLHRTRLDTLRHAADTALANHLRRTAELETEYLSRHPGREVDPARLRNGD